MDYLTTVPIYIQVMDMIRYDIVTGKLKKGDKLPSVRDMAVQYTINPNTAARVYKLLEEEGISFTRRGMGTFVTENEDKVKSLRNEIASGMARKYLEGMKNIGADKDEAIIFLEKMEGFDEKD